MLSLMWWSWGRDPSIPRTRRGTQKKKRNKTRILYIASSLIQKNNCLKTPTHVQFIKFGESDDRPRINPWRFLKCRSKLIDERDCRILPRDALPRSSRMGEISTWKRIHVSSTSTIIGSLTRRVKTIQSLTNCPGFLPGMYMLHSVRSALSYRLLRALPVAHLQIIWSRQDGNQRHVNYSNNRAHDPGLEIQSFEPVLISRRWIDEVEPEAEL